MNIRVLLMLSLLVASCGTKQVTIRPTVSSITESIYAAGELKSKNQYQVFATVNGTVAEVLVSEGQQVKKGQPILRISNVSQELSRENAALSAQYFDINSNEEKLTDAKQAVALAKDKAQNDSLLYARQKRLFQQNVGSQVELEQRALQAESSNAAYRSAMIKYNDIKRQLKYNSDQAKKNLAIAEKMTSDYTICSEIDGVVYSIDKEIGELVTPQSAVAVIGNQTEFILEMQVDEYDIAAIRLGQEVIITMDSYKGHSFRAQVSKISSIMNERTKSFKIEADFVVRPPVLYPNTSFEANIVVQTKNRALLIPRTYLLPNNKVLLKSGEKKTIKVGLKDFQQIEVLSGLTEKDELVLPEQ